MSRNAARELTVCMAEHDLSVKEVAAKLDCDPNYLSRIRRGRAKPGRDLASKIAEFTGGRVPVPAWGKMRADAEGAT